MRINKYLASLGYGSRREIDRLLEEGRITQNGRSLSIGSQLENDTELYIDKTLVKASLKQLNHDLQVLMYHKPLGEISSHRKGSAKGKTIFDRLPAVTGRWVAIGRLDVATTGLLIFTNQGDLAHQCMHPSFGLQRTYHAVVSGEFMSRHPAWSKGAHIGEERPIQVSSYRFLGKKPDAYMIEVSLKEGRYHAVRKFFESMGQQVQLLHRLSYGPIELDTNLQAGQFRHLKKHEIEALQIELQRKHIDLSKK